MPDTRGNAINVHDFIDRAKYSTFQWIIFAICLFIVILDGFDTAAIGYIAPSLMTEWHIARPDLAPVLSAALFGLAFGALCSGPIADRFGRKLVLLVSVAVMGAASIAAAYAADLQALTIWRFVTGLGLGAAMPNAVTLVAEYTPKSKRAFLTNAMFCGFPVGSAFGGFLAAWIIAHFGWRMVMLVGGVLPLLLTLAIVFNLPESVRYMAQRRFPAHKIRKALRRISPEADNADSFYLKEPIAPSEAFTGDKAGIGLVLSRYFMLGTICLWLAYFSGLVIVYGLLNWMPVIFKASGIDQSTAVVIAALFQLGGLGALASGWLMDRFNANYTVAFCYLLTSILVYCIGQSIGSVGGLALVVFLAGTAMNTAQVSMPTLAASFYPTRGRATGVSWMLGVGRFGGIAGTFMVAELARRQFGFSEIFAVAAVPAGVAVVALLVKQIAYRAEAAAEKAELSVLH
ncbi:aromatic acid/H+ symport family MFS transporter [Rhodoblastus sphagnicola]|uniref:Aromatic acid/H+ symport family MFS transporter n=1 Tax=Rhodoblastus sphagnicola TaxID=333368 RepID=A0A2S6MX38_9HYPH|nr:MFS transporter [Rhodoblastus sphagnicola]MBB4199247.1 AAHS family 4-hydroxybenzoate transporter-like MFS transporter [Rhodoblastus sphagnicola]PPQ26918.1 aromatic acid/H+ symport family MFS transporter [Rhodoblastus sphagnicola]